MSVVLWLRSLQQAWWVLLFALQIDCPYHIVASLHQAEQGFLVMVFKEDNRGSKGWGQGVEEWGSLVMA